MLAAAELFSARVPYLDCLKCAVVSGVKGSRSRISEKRWGGPLQMGPPPNRNCSFTGEREWDEEEVFI